MGLYSAVLHRGAGLFLGAGTGVEDEPVGGRHVLVVSEVRVPMVTRYGIRDSLTGLSRGQR
jgi:hypothetical protein